MNEPKTVLKTYKYRTQEAALYDLIEGSVYFAKSSEFHDTNDRLEGKFEIKNYKYLWSTILNAINRIEKKRTGHILEYPVIYSESEKNWISMSDDKFIKQSEEVGICSTSISYDNQAMWAHYCKNNGVCFEFEWDKDTIEYFNLLIKDVEYSNKPRKINRDVIFKNMIIDYGNDHPNATIGEIIKWSISKESSTKWVQNFVLESTCIKQICWSYENEIRIFSPRTKSYNILKRILRSVYLFIPNFNSADFLMEFNKSRILRLILGQILENYSDIKLYGLSYDKTGNLIKEEISLL